MFTCSGCIENDEYPFENVIRAAQPKEPHKNSKTFCGDPVSPKMVGSLAGGTIGVPAESIFGGAHEGETYRKGVKTFFVI